MFHSMTWVARLSLLVLVGALLSASLRIHHDEAGSGRDHDEQQQELCTEQAPPSGHHDHDAPGTPCSSPTHCSHGCSGHYVVAPVPPGGVSFQRLLAGFFADKSDTLLTGSSRSIDHPPKA